MPSLSLLAFGITLLVGPELPTGTLAVVNKADDSMCLVDLKTGDQLAKLPTGSNPQEIVFTPDGRKAILTNMGHSRAAAGKTLTVVDVTTRKVESSIDLGEHGMPHGLVVLDANRVLLTSHLTDHLVLVDLKKGRVERSFASGGKGTHLVVLSPDKKVGYAANVGTGTVTFLDLAAGNVLKTVTCGSRSEGIAVSPDGRTVSIGNIGENSVTVIDTAKGEVRATLPNLSLPIRTFFSSDSKTLFVSCAASGEIATFDASTLKKKKVIGLKGRKSLKLWDGDKPVPMNFDRHPKSKTIYVAIINADAVIGIDEATLEIVGQWSTGHLPDGIAITHHVAKSRPA